MKFSGVLVHCTEYRVKMKGCFMSVYLELLGHATLCDFLGLNIRFLGSLTSFNAEIGKEILELNFED